MCQNLERDFAGQNDEGVDTDKVTKLFGEEGELGETAHGKDALKDKFSPGMR